MRGGGCVEEEMIHASSSRVCVLSLSHQPRTSTALAARAAAAGGRQHGAADDVGARTHSNQTPLHFAAQVCG